MKFKIEHTFAVYAVGMLIAWGPAALEEDRLEAQTKAECPSLWREPDQVAVCKAWARNEYRQVLKAAMWPFWLSYRVAAAISVPSQGTTP